MTHITTSSDLIKIKELAYQDYLPELLPGTLLFCAGEYLISKMIRKPTRSLWSHVGMVFNVPQVNRTMLLESTYGSGVRLVSLAKYALDYAHGMPYHGTLVLAQMAGVTSEQERLMAQFGISLLTLDYDVDEFITGFFKYMKGSGVARRDREYHCAELVYECYLAAGIEIQYDRRGFITPENIWCDPRLSIVGRLVTEPALTSKAG